MIFEILIWFIFSYFWVYHRTEISYSGFSKIFKLICFFVDLLVLIPVLFLIVIKKSIDFLLK